MHEAKELALQTSAEKLRLRCMWAGTLLLLAILIPYEHVQGTPYFVWQLWPDLPKASQIVALSTPLAGLFILGLGLSRPSGIPLAFGVLFAAVTPQAIGPAGRAASSWFAAAPPFGPVAHDLCANLSLAAAATALSLGGQVVRPRFARRWAFLSLLAACVFVAFGCGDSDFFYRLLDTLRRSKSRPTTFGLVVLLCLQCWPLVVASLATLRLVAGPWKHAPTVGLIATFSYPLWAIVLAVLQSSIGGAIHASSALFLNGVLLASELALLSAALETLAWLCVQEPDNVRAQQATVRRFRLWASLGSSLLVGLVAFHRLEETRYHKGIRWTMGPVSPTAKKLFAVDLPRFTEQLGGWRRLGADDGGATRERLRQPFQPVLRTARQLDNNLAEQLAAMVQDAAQSTAPPRRWFRRVAAANARIRQLKLPYYLDPRLSFRQGKDGPYQKKEVAPFRVVEAPSFRVEGHLHTVLLVQRLSTHGRLHRSGLLGLSRDHQPFSVVLVDEVSARAEDIRNHASSLPALCGRSVDSSNNAALKRCGSYLSQIVKRLDDNLVSSQLNQAMRHEIQHQLDGPNLRLARLRMDPARRRSRRFRRQLNREISAFLAEIAGARSDSRLALTTLFMLALQDRGGIHRTAAQVVFTELAPTWPPTERKRSAFLLRSFEKLMESSNAKLRADARACWTRLYGRALQRLGDAKVR